MTGLEEKITLLSDFDQHQDCADPEVASVAKANLNHQAVIDATSNGAAATPPTNSTNNYPQADHYQKVVVITQPVSSYVTQQNGAYHLNDYRVKLVLLVTFSCLACCIFWPFAMAACCLTGSAYVAAADGKDPRFYMLLAIVMIILSFVFGIPYSVWYIATNQNDSTR